MRCTRGGEQEFGYCRVIFRQPDGIPNDHYFSTIFRMIWPGGVNQNARAAGANMADFEEQVFATYGRHLPNTVSCDYAVSEYAAAQMRERQKSADTASRVLPPQIVQTDLEP